MEYKNLVICDTDAGYMKQLSLLLAKHKDIRANISVFSDFQEAKIYADKMNVDILLRNEQCNQVISAGKIFILTERKEQEEASGDYIYKFQSVDKIIARILGTTNGKEGGTGTKGKKVDRGKSKKKGKVRKVNREIPGLERMKLIGVYSPVHRCGKTTYALSLGRELAKKYQVLYINLEGYAGIGEVFETGGDNLADLIYYTKQEQGNIGMRIGMMAKKHGLLDYIAPMPIAEELKTISKEEWIGLLSEIGEKSVYEVIVIDLGEVIQGGLELLELCDTIHMPILADKSSRDKLMQYEANLKLLHKERVLDKSQQIFLPEWVEDKWQEMMEGFVRRMMEKEEIL